jgi:hypothetical protein
MDAPRYRLPLATPDKHGRGNGRCRRAEPRARLRVHGQRKPCSICHDTVPGRAAQRYSRTENWTRPDSGTKQRSLEAVTFACRNPVVDLRLSRLTGFDHCHHDDPVILTSLERENHDCRSTDGRLRIPRRRTHTQSQQGTLKKWILAGHDRQWARSRWRRRRCW